MDFKKNLYIASTPLQLLNVLEAMHYFNTQNNILVIILNGVQKNTDQIEQLLANVKVDELIKIYPAKISKFTQYVKLINQLKENEYDYLFSGDFGTTQRVIIATLKKEKVYLLDDGAATINLYNKFFKNNKFNQYNLKTLRYLLFGFKIQIKEQVNLFTIFDFEPLKRIDIVKNDLSNLRSNFNVSKNNINNKMVYFLGQPVTCLFEKTDVYKSNIVKLSQLYSNKKIIYIPHRAEKEDTYNAILELQLKNIEICVLDKGVELYFLEQNIYPQEVISHVSTALFTLKNIYPDCISRYIPIPHSDNPKYESKEVQEVYDYYEKTGITKLVL